MFRSDKKGCTYGTFVNYRQRIQDNKRKICIITQLNKIVLFMNGFKLLLIDCIK